MAVSTRQALLQALSAAGGSYVSGQQLAETLGVSRAAVHKAAAALTAQGYALEAAPRRGYRLAGGDPFCTEAIGDYPAPIYLYDTLESSNRTAKLLALDGAPHGTLVLTAHQSAGRGRLGRRFESPAGKGVYCSVLLRPEMPAANAQTATISAAVAVCRAVKKLCGLELAVKWVNDLYYQGRKVCGILTEMSMEQGYIHHIVIGVGINVRRQEFPEEIRDPALEVKEIWFRYEKDSPDILKGVSFRVPKGTLFSIVGGNGTGKSTTLKAVCGICRPYRGKVRVDGQDTAKCRDLSHGKLAMLPQDPQCLFVKKTVREDLEEMLPASCPDKDRRIADMARLCDITALLEHHPYDLSGGEQQRSALAKVLLTEPKLLLLDEPTKGLDSFFKRQLAGLLRRLMTEEGVTIVMVSHDVEFCAEYADSVSMFFDGQLLTTNTPRRFFAQNSFYTTAANRMSRHLFPQAVTAEDVVTLMKENQLT